MLMVLWSPTSHGPLSGPDGSRSLQAGAAIARQPFGEQHEPVCLVPPRRNG